MVEKSNKFSRFWQELKRRKTNRVIVVYAATAFVILQLVEILAPALLLPEWTTTFIIILLAIGFPLTAIFSWFFDITPGGIEKTKPVSAKKKHKTEVELRAWKGTTLLSGIVIIALVLFNIIKGGIGTYEISKLDKSIAVLPFENLSDKLEHAWFGDAITDEIIMQLYKIKRFDVRSRTSIMQYKETDKTSPEIARELNVNFLVEGSTQLIDDQLRIRVQLIRAAKDGHLWGETYEGNTKDILAVQIEIAKKIADELDLVLTPEEIKKIEKGPTGNFNAYSTYISGNKIRDEAWYHLMRGNKYSDSTSFDDAIRMYDKAIEYDPLFALAYAKRAITRSWIYYTRSGDNANVLKCKEDIDKALELDPELTEAQIALGFYYYYVEHNYPEALKYFKKASDMSPENWEPVFYMALVHRRYGNWDMSQSLMSKVLKYNPQDALILTNIGLSYDYLRSYDSALIFHEKAINVIPDWESPYVNKIETLVRKNGSTGEARIIMDRAILKTGKSFLKIKVLLDIYDGKYSEVLNQTE